MIDLCIALSGPHLDLLLPLFLNTLERTHDMQNIRLHLVNKGISEQVRSYAVSKCFMMHDLPELFPRRFGNSTTDHHSWAHDTAGTCQWMLDNCGTEEWCFIAHFDIVFRENLISQYMALTTPETAQVGDHSLGLVGYRREAVRSSGARFDNLDGLRLSKDDGVNWKLRHAGDWRCKDDINILGLDVGEWLELHLRLSGWHVVILQKDELKNKLLHFRCGSGYHGDVTKDITRNQAIAELRERCINPII